MRRFFKILRLKLRIRKEQAAIDGFTITLKQLKSKCNIEVKDIPHLVQQYTMLHEKRIHYLKQRILKEKDPDNQ